MSSSAPRRRAARPPSRWARRKARKQERRAARRADRSQDRRGARTPTPRLRPVPVVAPVPVPGLDTATAPRRWLLPLWALIVIGGLAALAVDTAGHGPDQLARGGSVAIVTAYVWALAARTGGRPLVFGGLALVAGVGAIVLDRDLLTTGAAVMTCVVSAVLAVVATVPAVRFGHAAREVVVAVAIAAVGAVATVGFEPTISLARFEYVSLGLALAGSLGVVWRLGAGLHGLGRRGLLTVLVGSLLLAMTLAYAELLRRYGTPGLVEWLFDQVRWSRANLGAFPRPIEALLGIPAIAWGCHMRARRRQGWWVCAFGAAATAPVASALLNVSITRTESVLAVLYAVVVGLAVGFLVIRIDLRLTGPRGRPGRRAEEAKAIRPEPPRTSPLH